LAATADGRKSDSPFPGLRSFSQDESELFFGREGQSDELARKLGQSRFVAVVGTSGSGKSSLVRAGLLPSLEGGCLVKAGSNWRIVDMRPGGRPIDNLAAALDIAKISEVNANPTALRSSSLALLDFASQAYKEKRLDSVENLLILVDQFEELFRYKARDNSMDDRDEKAAFVKLLLEAAKQRQFPIYVVITMRSDFLGDCARFRDLPETINAGQYLIPRMTREQRREAIERPVHLAGSAIAPRLVQRILNDVGEDPDQLPVMQHALMRAWHHWRNRNPLDVSGNTPVDVEDYEAIGTLEHALSSHADQAYEEACAEVPGPGHQIVRRIFQRLRERDASGREVRRPTPLRELCEVSEASQDEVLGVLKHFRREGRSFLMPPTSVDLTAEREVDITHESLLREWKRLQEPTDGDSGWLAEEEESRRTIVRLADWAEEQVQGNPVYLRGPLLQLGLDWWIKRNPTEAWARRYTPNFQIAEEFLRESEKNEKRELEKKAQREKKEEESRRKHEEADRRAAEDARKRKWMYGLLSVAIVIAGIFFSLYKKNQSLLRENRASRLALQAAVLNSQHPSAVEASLLLATESMRDGGTVQNDEALRVVLALLPKLLSHSNHGGEQVNEVAFSSDGRYLATTSTVGASGKTPPAGITRIMDTQNNLNITSVALADEVNAVAFSPDVHNQYLATASGDTVRLIEAATGAEIYKFKHDGRINAVAFSPEGKYLATASEDRTARVMKIDTGMELLHAALGGAVRTVAYSPDGRHVAAGCDDGTVQLMEAATGKNIWSFREGLAVRRVAFNPDGRLVAVFGGGPDGPSFLRIRDTIDGRSKVLVPQPAGVTAVAFSPDGMYLGICVRNSDFTARLIRLDSGIEVRRFLFQDPVGSIAFSADGLHLATASEDNTARVFEVTTGTELARLPHQGQVDSVAFSPDGKRVATGSRDGTVSIMESSATKELLHLHSETKLFAAAFSPDQSFVATGDAGGAHVTEIRTGRAIGHFQHNAAVYALAFGSNNRYLATVDADNTGYWIDLATGHELWSPLHRGTLNAVAFSPDNELVIGIDNQVRLIEPLNGKEVAIASSTQPGKIRVLAASRNAIAVGSDNNAVRIYNIGSKNNLPVLTSEKQINILIFSPDGRYLAVACEDTVHLVTVARPNEVKSRKYPQWVYSVSFSADGQLMAVGGLNGMVRVIETKTGDEKSAFSHGEAVFDLAFGIVGGRLSLLAVAGDTVYQDLLLPADLRAEACSRASRNLTVEEWNSYVPGVGYRIICPNLPIPSQNLLTSEKR
jgi:WD40 repeat protein/energy-coupling factor transporter ATP-binding protein EcfA2